MYITNDVVANCIQTLRNSTGNIVRLMKKKYNGDNPDELEIFMSNPNFFWANELSIDITQMSIKLDKFTMIRKLDIICHPKHINDITKWIEKLDLLEDLKLAIHYYDDEEKRISIDISKFPSQLLKLSINEINDDDIIRHKKLKNLSTTEFRGTINFDNLPSLDEFNCFFHEGNIICTNERVFKYFNIDRGTGKSENILVCSDNGVIPYFSEDGNPIVLLKSCRVINYSSLSEKFYKNRPNIEELEIKGFINRGPIPKIVGSTKIKTISLSSEKIGFAKYFPNLVNILISYLYTNDFDKIWNFASENKRYKIIIKPEYVTAVSNPKIDYSDKYETPLENFDMECIRMFRTKDTDSLLRFVKKMDYDYFAVSDGKYFSEKWFDDYFFLFSGDTYYFTKKSLNKLIIKNAQIDIYSRNISPDCDNLDLQLVHVNEMRFLCMNSVEMRECTVSNYNNNLIKNFYSECSGHPLEITKEMEIVEISHSWSLKISFKNENIYVKKMHIKNCCMHETRKCEKISVFGRITFQNCRNENSERLENLDTTMLTTKKFSKWLM